MHKDVHVSAAFKVSAGVRSKPFYHFPTSRPSETAQDRLPSLTSVDDCKALDQIKDT